MVSLPELASYSQADHNRLNTISPIYDHYKKIIDKRSEGFAFELRRQRHIYWLQCAYASFLQTAPTEDICHFWSIKADGIIKDSWEYCKLNKMPVTLFALGKLGSQELNLSSDIDVVFVQANSHENSSINPALRKWIQLLSQTDENGFVFRVDTSIRPGGNTSPLCPEVDHFIHYYGYLGEAWNRISFVRLRPIIGEKQTIEKIQNFCKNFSYPRRLDYSIINNIKSLRAKIKKENFKTKDGINIKIAPGGIRDIELYLQSLQVIYGGRKNELKSSSISSTIKTLSQLEIISEEEALFFQNFYWQLRTIENLIQAYADQHSYILNEKIWNLVDSLYKKEDLVKDLKRSEELISSFFIENNFSERGVQEKLANSQLSSQSKDAIHAIIDLKSSSLKKANVESQKNELLSTFLDLIEEISLDKDLGVQTFKDFIFSIKSKSSIFYMLNKKPDLLEHLVWLFSFSPYVGRTLCSRPELLDSFALGSVEIQEKNKNIDILLEDLLDYKLLTQMISASHFLKNLDVWGFCQKISASTNAIAKILLNQLKIKFSGSNIDILRLGKWGGDELGIHSDLDFIFVTDQNPTTNDLQIARRFINLVSSPSNGGQLFNIDLRLKPNEQAGPLIVSREQLDRFIAESAEPWQKQAYLKSHFLIADRYYYQSLRQPIQFSTAELKSIEENLQKIIQVKNNKFLDIKYNPGGLIHSEFKLQMEVLRKGCLPEGASTQSFFLALESQQQKIWQNYSFLRTFEQLYGLCTDLSSPRVAKNHPSLNRISQALKCDDPYQILEKTLDEQAKQLNFLDATH